MTYLDEQLDRIAERLGLKAGDVSLVEIVRSGDRKVTLRVEGKVMVEAEWREDETEEHAKALLVHWLNRNGRLHASVTS